MRWVVLILGMLLMTGCGDLAYSVRSHFVNAYKDYKDYKNSLKSTSGYVDESDSSKAHHEQTLIHDLNNSIGNRQY